MITVLARFEMQKGKEDVALQALSKMADEVKAHEPNCLVYAVTRGQVNLQEVYIYEVYADEDAFRDHRRTDHMRELQAALDESLDRSSFNVEILEHIGGFVRHSAATA
jgi:quinol monooxygenase YgiN